MCIMNIIIIISSSSSTLFMELPGGGAAYLPRPRPLLRRPQLRPRPAAKRDPRAPSVVGCHKCDRAT